MSSDIDIIFKDNRAPTNVDELNVILEGGLPKSNVILTGPSCEEKLMLGLNLSLADGTKTLIVCLDSPPEVVRDKIRSNRLNESNVGAYLDLTGKNMGQHGNIIGVDGPSDLNEISLKIKEFLDKYGSDGHARILFYSLSKMLISVREESVLKLIKLINERVRTYKAVGIYFIDEATHNEQLMRKIRNMIRTEIEFKKSPNNTKNGLVVEFKSLGVEVPISISPDGRLKVI